MLSDYKKAQSMGLTQKRMGEQNVPHHPMSERLMAFLSDHDFYDYDDFFCWECGGVGDNGEILMDEMDAFFELLELV